MKLIILGTGTSQGIPVVGCSCAVCASADLQDRRLRASAMLIHESHHLLIDLSPDLRQQLLANDLDKVDTILLTHEHNDHVGGLDDIRPVNFKWRKSIPMYALPRVIGEVKGRFPYAFNDGYAARPRLDPKPVNFGDQFLCGPLSVTALRVNHGHFDILGYKIHDVAYLTDLKSIDQKTIDQIKGIGILVISALRREQHASHQTFDEALDLVRQINPGQTYLTHISHQLGRHQEVMSELPDGVDMAYDGLVVDVN